MTIGKIFPGRWGNSIAFRYLLVASTFLVMIQLLFGLGWIRWNFRQRLLSLEEKVERQARFLSAVSPESILSLDFLTLERLMRETSQDRDIVYSLIVSPEGGALTRFIDSDNPHFARILSEDSFNSNLPNILNRIDKVKQQAFVREIAMQIIFEDQVLGELQLGYSIEHLRQEMFKAAAIILLSSISISLLLATLTIVLFNYQVRKPLKELVKLAKALASGDLDCRVTVKRPDEIGQLKTAFNRMAKQLRSSFKDLSDYKQALDRAAIVAIADRDKTIRYVNDKFCEVSQCSRATLLDGMHQLIDGIDGDEERDRERWGALAAPFSRSIASAIAQGEIWRGEIQNKTPNGRIYWLDLTIVPFLGEEDGKPLQYLAIGYEVTERKQTEKELKDFNTKLQQSNRELQDFAYVASHDLQEPLRKIQAFGDRLETKFGQTLTEKGRDYLHRMLNAAERAQTLINDLLAFSRVTTKAQPFSRVNLNQILQEVLSDLEVQIEQTGAQIECGALPTLDADPLQMRQLFQNLTSNALKFRQQDVAPMIDVQAEPLEPAEPSNAQSGNTVSDSIDRAEGGTDRSGEGTAIARAWQLSICDNGIGFDEKYLDRIFTVFQRLHSRNTYEGTGVGLAICRKIVERHAGTITATSSPGQGTCFIVTLPDQQSESWEHK